MLGPGSRRKAARLTLEQLEDRLVLSGTPTNVVVPNDPQFSTQYALQNTGQNGGTAGVDINATGAWSVVTGNPTVSVAVIDTGIDYDHPDLYDNIWINQAEIPKSRLQNLVDVDHDGVISFADLNNPINQGPGKVQDLNHDGRIDASDILAPMVLNAQGQDTGLGGWAYPGNTQDGDTAHPNDFIGWNFIANTNDPMDDNGHGTNVAGVIGAMTNNGTGVAGVAWNTSLMDLKFEGSNGFGTASTLIAAIQYATQHGAKILNNSWAGVGNWPNLQTAIQNAQSAGEIFVVAAGNGASNLDTTPTYPMAWNLSNVVSVAAVDDNGNLANFSNYGPQSVSLAAPGVSVVSTYPGKSYNINTGTSMSVPFVTGVMDLVWSEHPDWSASQVINDVMSTVTKLPSLQGKLVSGGMVNAAAAVGWTPKVPPPASPPPPPAVSGAPSIISDTLLSAPNTISELQVTFSQPIMTGSFTTADVFFYNPSGQQISASSVALVPNTNGTEFDIFLPTQTAAGGYSLKIGPEVFNNSWTKMTVFQTTLWIGPVVPPPPIPAGPPIIISDSLVGQPNTISELQVTFNKPVMANSFTTDDVFFFNPSGQQIAATAVTLVAGSNDTAFDIFIPTQTAPGVYNLKIGPEVFDNAWTKMTVFQTTFTIGQTITASSATTLVIPSSATASSAVRIDQTLTVQSVAVSANITFPKDGNLVLILQAPDGTQVTLANQRGGSGANYQNTTFSDIATTPIASATAPFSGTYQPDAKLAALVGKNTSGIWKLLVENTATGVTGTLNNWSLTLIG